MNGPDLLALAETESKNNQRALQDQVIYGHIFDAILEQKLSPGTRLSEERLGELFGVSRTIIRRALSRLAHESVIELRPNRGAVVASPTPREAESVLYARRVAERSIVELATLNARKPGFKKALKALETHIKEEHRFICGLHNFEMLFKSKTRTYFTSKRKTKKYGKSLV